MKPVKTNTSNCILKGSGDVQDLHVTSFEYQDGTPAVESCWELNEEEKKEVLKTGKIYFLCLGKTHPPILLKTEPELQEE